MEDIRSTKTIYYTILDMEASLFVNPGILSEKVAFLKMSQTGSRRS